jgi:hypothetical protein
LPIEGFEGGEVELLDEKLIADAAEEAFDLSLGGSVPDGIAIRAAMRRHRATVTTVVDGADVPVGRRHRGDGRFPQPDRCAAAQESRI